MKPTGAGVITVRKINNKWQVLALTVDKKTQISNRGELDLCKGSIDPGETEWSTAIREAYEEASFIIDTKDILFGPITIDWLTLWVVDVGQQTPKITPNPTTGEIEHTGYLWLEFDEFICRAYIYLTPFLIEARDLLSVV